MMLFGNIFQRLGYIRAISELERMGKIDLATQLRRQLREMDNDK